MEKVHEIFDKVKEYAIYYYGPDQPQRMWYFVLTAFVALCFVKSTKRFAGIAICVWFLCFIVWNFLSDTFKQTAPDPLTTVQGTPRRR